MKNALLALMTSLTALIDNFTGIVINPLAFQGQKKAKIKFGMMMTDARNKLGGQVFSKNRGGAYVRTKVTPSNAQTSFQTAVRAILSFLAASFRTLTANQILAWNNAVSDFTGTDIFGDVKTPSGENLYIKLNANLAKVGSPYISDPPLPTNVPSLTGLVVSAAVGANAVLIAANEITVGVGERLYIEATPCLSPGKSFVKSEFRTIGFTATNAAIPYAAGTLYAAKFGALVAGQKLFIRVQTVNIATGLVSLKQTAFCIVAP